MENLIGQLADSTKRLTKSQIANLSDLYSEDAKRFRDLWQGLGVKRRRQLISQLVSEAEANIEVNFDRVLIACLNDGDEIVRTKAIEGLWECYEPDLVKIFSSLLMDDPSLVVRAAAAKALGVFALLAEIGKIRPQYAEQLETSLLKILEDNTQGMEIRQGALESISYFNKPKITDIIQEAYQSVERPLKISAIRAMGRNIESNWLKILLEELSSPEADLRLEAAKACGEMGDEKAVINLIERSEDEDPEVQVAAIQALGQIGGKRAMKALTGMLKHTEEIIRVAAAESLQEAQFLDDPTSISL